MHKHFLFNIFSILSLLCIFTSITAYSKEVLIPTDTIQQQTQNEYYIVSIGVNQYQDEFWPNLKWPVNDANKVSDSFGQNTRYHINKLTILNQDATLKNIQKKLNAIKDKITFEDTVILYFSGHGTLAKDDNGELSRVAVLYDTDNNSLLTTGLTHQWLRQWQDSLKAKKKMMIFATCNSGVGKSRIPESVQNLLASQKGKLIPLEDVSEGALILAAAAKGEAAREDDILKGDIYTHFLIKALSIYDRNHDGMVSALEAHDYAREQTWTFTRGKQRPTADVKLIGNADIPLQGKKFRTAVPILEAYDEELAGFQIQIDNGMKGRLPLAFALKPEGSYISLYAPESGKQLASYRVTLSEGESISLHNVLNVRPIGVGLAQHINFWQDDTLSNLKGSDTTNEFFATLSWNVKSTGFGFAYPFKPQNNNNEIRPTLDSRVKLNAPFIFIEYRKTFNRLNFVSQAQLGRETINVRFKDTVDQYELNYYDTSISYGVAFFIGYDILPDLSLNLELGLKQSNWQLENIGNLSGKRNSIGLGLHYQFDWKVRQL